MSGIGPFAYFTAHSESEYQIATEADLHIKNQGASGPRFSLETIVGIWSRWILEPETKIAVVMSHSVNDRQAADVVTRVAAATRRALPHVFVSFGNALDLEQVGSKSRRWMHVFYPTDCTPYFRPYQGRGKPPYGRVFIDSAIIKRIAEAPKYPGGTIVLPLATSVARFDLLKSVFPFKPDLVISTHTRSLEAIPSVIVCHPVERKAYFKQYGVNSKPFW